MSRWRWVLPVAIAALSGCAPDPTRQARKLMELGMAEQARTLLKEQMSKHPEDARVYLWAGNATLQQIFRDRGSDPLTVELLKEACEDYDAAGKLAPKVRWGRLNTIMLLTLKLDLSGASARSGRDLELLHDRLEANICASAQAGDPEAGALFQGLRRLSEHGGLTVETVRVMEEHKSTFYRDWRPGRWIRPAVLDPSLASDCAKEVVVLRPETFACLRTNTNGDAYPMSAIPVRRVAPHVVIVSVRRSESRNGFVTKVLAIFNMPRAGGAVSSSLVLFENPELSVRAEPGAHSVTYTEDATWAPASRPWMPVRYEISWEDSCVLPRDSVVIRPLYWPGVSPNDLREAGSKFPALADPAVFRRLVSGEFCQGLPVFLLPPPGMFDRGNPEEGPVQVSFNDDGSIVMRRERTYNTIGGGQLAPAGKLVFVSSYGSLQDVELKQAKPGPAQK